MDILEKFGSTWLGRLLDKKAKKKEVENDMDKFMYDDIKKIAEEKCTCTRYYQSYACPAYDHRECIWHPDNDPHRVKE